MPAGKVPSGVMQQSRPPLGRALAGAGIAGSGADGRSGAVTDATAPRERTAARARSAAARIEGKAREELKLVMREIADALSARTTALTMHPADARPPTVLHADEASIAAPERIEELLRTGRIDLDLDADGAGHRWLSQLGDVDTPDILLISVDRVEGHSALLISAFFDPLDPERRRAAEEVYLRRRPFAVGYFRLWQLERTRRHRIAALQAAINLTEVGVMLIDRRGGLVFCNDAGMRILEEGDGLARRSQSLHATNLREDIRLQVALGHVIETSLVDADDERERRAPIMSISRLHAPPLILSVLPTGEPAVEPSDVAAILYVLDPALDTDQLLEPVCKLFQLTPVETKLVCQLAGGATLAQAAESMRVKELTARSCLKQVFLKTAPRSGTIGAGTSRPDQRAAGAAVAALVGDPTSCVTSLV